MFTNFEWVLEWCINWGARNRLAEIFLQISTNDKNAKVVEVLPRNFINFFLFCKQDFMYHQKRSLSGLSTGNKEATGPPRPTQRSGKVL